jgi:hypothetical protein
MKFKRLLILLSFIAFTGVTNFRTTSKSSRKSSN